MQSTSLRRCGHILGALVLAVLIAGVGSQYKSRSQLGPTLGPGVQLMSAGVLKVEPDQDPSAAQMALRSDWVPMDVNASTGWSKKTLWMRLEMHNTTPLAHPVWLEVEPRRMAYVELHQRGEDGTWRAKVAGVSVPTQERLINLPDIVFPIQLQPFEQRVVLVRVDTQINHPPINLAVALHEPTAFLGLAAQGSLTDLLLIGATLALGSICLLVGAYLRQPVQVMLGLRSLALVIWLLMHLGFLSMLLPGAVVAVMALHAVWIAWLILVLTIGFVWLYLASVSARGLPRWGHIGFGFFAVLIVLSAAVTLAGLQPTTPWVLQLGQLFIAGTVFTLVLSAFMVWRGQVGAALIVVTSCSALLMNAKLHLSVLGITHNDVLRLLISPIPVLVTTAVLFIGLTLQLLRERQTRQALLMQGHRQTMALLEEKVAERTAALQQATREAHLANAAKSLFMAKISHELRTPMHAVLGYLGLLLRDKPPEAMVRRLNVAQRAGQQLVGQIDDLLDYVRIGHEPLCVDVAVFALPALLDSVGQRASLLANESGNQFHAEHDADLPGLLSGDSLRIEQVLMVLLANAMRYTQNGRVTLRVASSSAQGPTSTNTGTHQALHRLHFSVTDTGRGIAPEALADIFSVFERGSATDRDGLGLGLPIAKHILALMGSRLEVQSELGHGSVFSFTLELACDEAARLAWVEEKPASHGVVGYVGKTMTILLLEDDPASSQYLQEVLTGLGFGVCGVADVPAAENAVRELEQASGASGVEEGLEGVKGGFDLYIVDQNLGDGATGWDFVRYVRSAPGLPAAWRSRPMLMLSASHPITPPGWNPQHEVAHLLKPLSADQLLQALTHHLQPQWIDLLAADAPHPAEPLPQAEPWADLHSAAQLGSVTQLHQWRMHNATRLKAHPALATRIERLDFSWLVHYADEQRAGASV